MESLNVVITGASRGIGLELAHQALEQSHRVAAIARAPDKSPGIAKLRAEFGDRLSTISSELTDPDSSSKIREALKGWNQVDVLINNAGIMVAGETAPDFLRSFHVNSVVPFLLTRELLPLLKKSKKAKVMHVTSQMGSIEDNGSGGHYAYRSSKSALNMINKSLSIDHPELITVVAHPGWVQTEMGGPGAPTSPRDSASGLWRVLHALQSKDTGQFFNFRGDQLPW